MRKLTPPDFDAVDIYKTIHKNKKDPTYKKNLEKLEKYVLDRYIEYDEIKTTLEKISNSSITNEEEKEALLSCYGRRGYLESKVISKIITLNGSRCPYCCLDRPNTIDHYLPKDKFPEYAFYPYNLLPCCSECNSLKGEKWITKDKRNFLNFYYDEVREEKFLEAIIHFDEDDIFNTTSVEFRIIESVITDPELKRIIVTHFDNLNLKQEYASIVTDEVSIIYDKIETGKMLTVDEQLSNLERERNSLAKILGNNNWRTALYDGFISSKFVQAMYKNIT